MQHLHEALRLIFQVPEAEHGPGSDEDEASVPVRAEVQADAGALTKDTEEPGLQSQEVEILPEQRLGAPLNRSYALTCRAHMLSHARVTLTTYLTIQTCQILCLLSIVERCPYPA